MRFPSTKILMRITRVDEENVVLARRIGRASDPEEIKLLSMEFPDESISNRLAYGFRRLDDSALSEIKMLLLDHVLHTYGVEYVQRGHNRRSPAFSYLNTGHVYDATLVLVNDRFRVTSVGDLVEAGHYN